MTKDKPCHQCGFAHGAHRCPSCGVKPETKTIPSAKSVTPTPPSQEVKMMKKPEIFGPLIQTMYMHNKHLVEQG